VTVVGHTLLGASLAAVALPRPASARLGMAVGFLAGMLANAPDLPFPGWGHAAYGVSHSAFLALAAGIAVAATSLVLLRERGPVSPGRAAAIAVALGIAWPSHLVLDGMYAHGRGVGVGWPFAPGLRIVCPIPWFETLRLAPMDPAHNARVFAIEAVCYGAVLAAALAWRRLRGC